MKAEDFSAWLSAIAGMSVEQRREALRALTGADGDQAKSAAGDLTEASGGKADKPGRREDALGTTGHERVESHGCPHCAGREIVGWGRSHGGITGT